MKTSRMFHVPLSAISGGLAVCAPGAGMQLAQHLELARGRRRRLGDLRRVLDLPAGIGVDLLAGDTRMDRGDSHLFRGRVRLEHAEIGDQLGRALGLDAELLTRVAAGAVAERGEEVDLLDEAALAVAHDDENL